MHDRSHGGGPPRCPRLFLLETVPSKWYIYIVHMTDIRFEWDNAKAALNKRKHGVSFEEAQTVFYDEHAIEFFDPDHSEREDRFIMLGVSFRLRLLVVCHCVRETQSVIRIISARRATRREAKHYRREHT